MLEARLREIEEENELLLDQLHVVQEELERRASSAPADAEHAVATVRWVDDEFPDAIAENLRLKTALQVQKMLRRQSGNALNVRLGNILIKGFESKGELFSLPGKLLGVWRETTRHTPPEVLGGKGFEKAISAYREGGLPALEKLLASVTIGPFVHASALTAVARSLMHQDPVRAAEISRGAYDVDPRPFRLKWLAFRLHEAGEVIEAEALIDALPKDVQFSESESKQADRIRREAKRARLLEAKKETGYSERRAQMQQQFNKLVQEKDSQARLALERGRDVEKLQAQKAALEHEKNALSGRFEVQSQALEERGRAVDVLKAQNAQLEQQQAILTAQCQEKIKLIEELRAELEKQQTINQQHQDENQSLIDQLHIVQEGLERSFVKTSGLEQEKSELAGRYEAQSRVAEERGRAVEALQVEKAQLEQEKFAVAARCEEQTKLAEAHTREIEALKSAKAQLAQEKSAVAARHEEQMKLAASRAGELEMLRAAKVKLEQEKATAAVRHEEASRLAEERQKQLDELQQQFLARQTAEAELATRNQTMREELVRAEAQIDLIKQMLFGQSGK